MSKSRKKAKKQLKKQNRQTAVTKPSLPRAKRKGGRYVYPAGAYRSVMIDPPVLKGLADAIIPAFEPDMVLPLLKPDEIIQFLQAELLNIPAETAEIRQTPQVINEPHQSVGFTPQPWMYALVLAGCALLGFTLMRPAAPQRTIVPGAIKQKAVSVLHENGLKLEAAEASFELSVRVDLESLRAPVEEYLSGLEGDWAVYIRNLNTDEVLTINDHQMSSASLIKLFTAGCYFEETEAGRLEVSDRSENDLEYMICWSDNDAWEDLETLIGHGDYNAGLNAVTSFAKAHGFEDTGRLIGGENIYSFEADNTTSVSDTGELLSQVYHKEFVSEAASEKLLELMKEQHIITKIPAGLPEGIESANKTGELSGIENDAAIVWGENTDYILVIMNDYNYIGTQPVADLSEMIYGLLNPGASEENNENS